MLGAQEEAPRDGSGNYPTGRQDGLGNRRSVSDGDDEYLFARSVNCDPIRGCTIARWTRDLYALGRTGREGVQGIAGFVDLGLPSDGQSRCEEPRRQSYTPVSGNVWA